MVGSTRRDRVVPDQHGAWGFLLLPVFLGVAAGGWSWQVLPTAAAWVAAYPLSWAVSGRLSTPRRPERFDRALLIWAAFAVPLMAVSVVLTPWLVWVGLAYLVPFGVNLAFARARRERDLANDLVLVAECAAAVPVVVAVASGHDGWVLPTSVLGGAEVGLMTLVCAVTLVGSTLHVKSLIRRRDDPRYAAASMLFSIAAAPGVAVAAHFAGQSWWIAAPFVLLAIRAVVRNPSWRPGRIGMVELACLVCVAATSVLALR